MSGKLSSADLLNRSNASLTQLPPSPELKAMNAATAGPVPQLSLVSSPSRPVSLNSNMVSSSMKRLRSVARYQSFEPQVLACSDSLTAYDQQPSNSSAAISGSKNSPIPVSSLGAVAGPQGVALFHLSRPHVPLLILSHATNTSSASSTISSLAFEPKTFSNRNSTGSLHLAAARGSGVLVWDASGHSPNPLVGRVGTDRSGNFGSGMTSEDSDLTSICWKSSTSSIPLLATTSASALCLWDLRAPASGTFKPAIRYGTLRKAVGPTPLSPFVQVACSADSDECATIDASGIVRIYDVRMTDRGRQGNPVSTFAGHETAGVGIAYFGSHTEQDASDNTSSSSRWLTWGLDVPMSSAVVKVWMKSYGPQDPRSETNPDTDEYWDMSDPIPSTVLQNQSSQRLSYASYDYIQTAQCVRSNLACARVCQSPSENMFMTMGHLTNSKAGGGSSVEGWWAELYSLSDAVSDDANLGDPLSNRTFGLKKIVGLEGGEASSSPDKETLTSVLGNKFQVGNLQAAELAVESSSSEGKTGDTSEDTELILCCLTDSGVFTTHSIPEALPRKSTQKQKTDSQGRSSPKRSLLRNPLVRTGFPASNKARVYPEDREGTSLFDAAGYWGGPKKGSELSHQRVEEKGPFEQNTSSPTKAEKETKSFRRQTGEMGLMPFDMDVPVAYGSVTAGNAGNLPLGITDMSTGAMLSTTAMGGVVEEGEKNGMDQMSSKSIMDTIDTKRVPCPRLCGAVFGGGNGGLMVFHNGEVKKMWNWYQRTDSSRQTQDVPGKSMALNREEESFQLVRNRTSSDSSHPLPTKENADDVIVDEDTLRKQGPRNLKELMDMMATAKEAQWGAENDSEESEGEALSSVGEDFFEDESLGSNSSDDEDEAPEDSGDLYKRYFGEQGWSNSSEKLDVSPEDLSGPVDRVKKMRGLVGPSADTLSPVVWITHRYDREMLSAQSFALAEEWKLGAWTFDPLEQGDRISLEMKVEESKNEATTPDYVVKVLPHYRSLVTPPGRKTPELYKIPPLPKSLPRTKSDGNLGPRLKAMNMMSPQVTSERMVPITGSPGRPNVTLIKNMFVYPQQNDKLVIGNRNFDSPTNSSEFLLRPLKAGDRTMSTGYIPPSPGTVRLSDLERASSSANSDYGGEDESIPLGVYTLSVSQSALSENRGPRNDLKKIRELCLHNASVCAKLNETEKEGVWNLLAQTAENQSHDHGRQRFGGWGGRGGGALGVELVANLLKFYEAKGDSQMLATLICVLSGGRRSFEGRSVEEQAILLPPDPGGKYDMYIHQYAELLYTWGLLTLRAEVNKHLLQAPSPIRILSSSAKTSLNVPRNTQEESKGGPSPIIDLTKNTGIAWNIRCGKCGKDTEANTNLCRNCQDFAFRCSLCDNAVQGLFTVCELCGHGGHMEHLSMWFTNHLECPTGCGCQCARSSRLRAVDEGVITSGGTVGSLGDFELL